MNRIKLIFFYFLFLISYTNIIYCTTTTTQCKSCIKAFDLNNTIIGDTIETPSIFHVTVFGNAAYNNLVEHGPPINITGTITTPYNIQPIIDIINMTFLCNCNTTYPSGVVSNVIIYPGRTCFISSSTLGGTITFDALGDPSSIFILTFQSSSINLQYQTALTNNAQPCNINLIVPNQIIFLTAGPFYGNFFAQTIFNLATIDVHGGLYASNTVFFGDGANVYSCSCQLPENQYDKCTPRINHKQIIYNVKCSNSLSCSQ
jgi:hypothetical protein